MLVADINHYLNLPDDTNGSLTALARRLTRIVHAGTAGPTNTTIDVARERSEHTNSKQPAGLPWNSALRCHRRPGRQPCPGHLTIRRTETATGPDPTISWQCSHCDDDGLITGWRHTLLDLAPGLNAVNDDDELSVVISHDQADAIRSIQTLDTETMRLVYRARTIDTHPRAEPILAVELTGNPDDLDELANHIAAEANHAGTPTKRRRTLDAIHGIIDTALAYSER